jgi:adenylate kinase family enzyme
LHRIVIFGNSGSGKSTLAKHYVAEYRLAHLDFDVLAWNDTNPPKRKSLKDSAVKIHKFLNENQNWVIEGCYSGLLGLAIKKANEVIFLNPGVKICIDN